MNAPLLFSIVIAISAAVGILMFVPLKSRTNYLRDLCRRYGLTFSEKNSSILDRLKFFKIYQAAPDSEAAFNVLWSQAGQPEVCIFDYKTGAMSNGEPLASAQTVFYFRGDMKLPGFRFYPKEKSGADTRKQESLFKYRPIVFSSCPAFSELNQIVGPDDNEIREFFSQQLLEKLLKFRNVWVEGYGSELLVYRRNTIVSGKSIGRHYRSAQTILRLLQERSAEKKI
jgi:hypothetical protein